MFALIFFLILSCHLTLTNKFDALLGEEEKNDKNFFLRKKNIFWKNKIYIYSIYVKKGVVQKRILQQQKNDWKING